MANVGVINNWEHCQGNVCLTTEANLESQKPDIVRVNIRLVITIKLMLNMNQIRHITRIHTMN